jgi:hypothetical protein
MFVPVVAIVDAVKIEFYPDEHPPPHFHARYAEFVAQIENPDQQGFTWFVTSRETQPCAILGCRTSGGTDERQDCG